MLFIRGRTASFADLRSGRGHTVPSAPTAFPKKANRKEFTFCSAGKALQKQVSRFIKSKKGRKSTVPAQPVENSGGKHKRAQPRENSRTGPSLLIGKDLRSGHASGGNHESKPRLWRVSLHKGVSFRSIYPIVTVQCLTGRSTSYADAQRLSRLRRQPRKQTAIGLFCAPRRKSYESSYAIVTAQCFTGALPGRVV